LKEDGSVWGFGKNNRGQLASVDNEQESILKIQDNNGELNEGVCFVLFPDFKKLQKNSDFIELIAVEVKGELSGRKASLIAAGQEFSLAVTDDGTKLVSVFVVVVDFDCET
jgi:alpha-tubulin suppressor-like RCC1 family protein